MSEDFYHCQAFSSQVGCVATGDQDALRHKRVAIAGMADAGVSHLLALTRRVIGKPKADVLAAIAKENNPRLDIGLFSKAVGKFYMSECLAGTIACSGGLDLFALSAPQGTLVAGSNSSRQTIAAAPLEPDLCRGRSHGGAGDQPPPSPGA